MLWNENHFSFFIIFFVSLTSLVSRKYDFVKWRANFIHVFSDTSVLQREIYDLTLEKLCLNREYFFLFFSLSWINEINQNQAFLKKSKQAWSFNWSGCFVFRVIFNIVCEQTGAKFVVTSNVMFNSFLILLYTANRKRRPC